MPPTLIDQAALKFREFGASIDWAALAEASARETASRVYASRPPPKRTLIGEEAADYLQSLIVLTELDILERHSAYGSVRWLWYLRRTPDELFEGNYGTTLGYDRLLAEVISSKFNANDLSEKPARVSFPADVHAFRHLVRYIGRVKHLSNLHSAYRRVGKGGVLDASMPIPRVEANEQVEQAIHIYDERHDRLHEFTGAGLGMVAIEATIDAIASKSAEHELGAFLSIRCSPSFAGPVTFPDDSGTRIAGTAQIHHVPQIINLAKILLPLGSEGGIPQYLPKIAPICQLLILMPTIVARVPWALSSIVQQGYFFIGEPHLRSIFDTCLGEVVERLAFNTRGFMWPKSFDAWNDAIKSVDAPTWPMAGGKILRPFHENVLIDITGASQALLHRVELTRSPEIGNIRAKAFELQCQEVINRTHWKPSMKIHDLRGRQLRRNGKTITDIDAVGEKDGVLLLVSCKSIIYDRDYDRGVFKCVRNTQDTIDAAVLNWLKIVDEITRNRSGENFDLAQFKEIIGVVCTPFVGYSSNANTLAFAKPNLRRCSSILELRDWLAAN